MNTKEQLLFDKMEEYIIEVNSIFIVHKYPSLIKLSSEISQLKSTLEKEQLSGTININDDSNSVMSGEQSEISAEEVLDKYILQAKEQGLTVEIKGRYWVEKAMIDFRNSGMDWEKIEREFTKASNLYLHDLSPEWIINWFKSKLGIK